MSSFVLRIDSVETAGRVATAWVEPSPPFGSGAGTWHIMVELPAGDPLLVAADGRVNPFGWLDCQITPVTPYRDEPHAGRLLGEMIGKKVRLGGSWGDRFENGTNIGTQIVSIAWLLVDRGITPIIEEHGFSQVVRDADLFAFSDDAPFVLGEMPPPFHQEDRHVEVDIPFPFRPQSNAVPVFTECVDRDDLEQLLYAFRSVPAPHFPLHSDRQHTISIVAGPASDVLRITVDTGTPGAGQGFFYAKLVLTYDEGFDTMCDPDVCLTDPNRSCQTTGEERLTYVWPCMSSALAGDLLLGPAGGKGVLGRLLGALWAPVLRSHGDLCRRRRPLATSWHGGATNGSPRRRTPRPSR